MSGATALSPLGAPPAPPRGAGRLRRRLPGVLAAAAACALGWAAGGVGLALLLLAAVLLAAALPVVVPALAGPARWAGAAVVLAAYALAASFLTPLLDPASVPRRVALPLLALPSAAAAAVLVVRARPWRRRGGGPGEPRGPGPAAPGRDAGLPAAPRRDPPGQAGARGAAGGPGAAGPGARGRAGEGVLAGLALAVLGVPVLARLLRGGSAGIAWAMSGDNANHVALLRDVVARGGVTADQMVWYPVGAHGLAALVAGADGRTDLTRAGLLEADVRAVAAVWLLAAVAVVVLSGVAVLLCLPDGVRARRRLPAPAAVAVAAAGALAATGSVLGVALAGGFFSAFAGAALLLAAVVLAVHGWARPHPAVAGLLVVDAGVLLAYRPLFWPVVLLLAAAVLARGRRLGTWSAWSWAVLGALVAAAAALGVVVAQNQDRLREVVAAPGAFPVLVPALLWVVGCAAVGVAALRGPTALLPVAGVAAAFLALAEWAGRLAPEGAAAESGGTAYAAAKLVWAGWTATAWVLLVPVALAAVRPGAPAGSRPRGAADAGGTPDGGPPDALGPGPAPRGAARARPLVASVALSAAALLAVSAVSPVASPVRGVLTGWARPASTTVDRVLAGLDEGPVVLPWLYGTADGESWPSFGEDRAGILWAQLDWGDQRAPWNTWALALVDGNPSTLCLLVVRRPGAVVVTRDAALERRTRAACGPTDTRFAVERPLYVRW